MRWSGFLNRWRWPIIGSEGGVGGHFLFLSLKKKRMSFVRERREMRETAMLEKLKSIVHK